MKVVLGLRPVKPIHFTWQSPELLSLQKTSTKWTSALQCAVSSVCGLQCAVSSVCGLQCAVYSVCGLQCAVYSVCGLQCAVYSVCGLQCAVYSVGVRTTKFRARQPPRRPL